MPLLFPSFSPSFLVFLFFISVGWLVDSKFSARSSRGAKIQQLFFPSWRELHYRRNVRFSWPNFFYQDYLQRSWKREEEKVEERIVGDNLYHPGAATRNGFCLLRREGEIIFCYKSMDPRVFNQILRFFVLEEEEDTMEKTSWI